MDDFQYRDLKIGDDLLKRLQTRSAALSPSIKQHLQRWVEITRHAGIRFSVDEQYQTANGEFLGKEFRIAIEVIASGSDVFALISVITQDSLSGKAILIDSYCLNTYGYVLGSISKTPLEIDEDAIPEHNEYAAICEVLYSLATRKYHQ